MEFGATCLDAIEDRLTARCPLVYDEAFAPAATHPRVLIAQQISLPAALGGRYSDDPVLARLLGYDTLPAASVLEWRRRRLDRPR